YQTSVEVDTAISDALVPYYTAAQVDAEIAANGFNGRLLHPNPERLQVFTLVRDSVSIPRQIRGILSRAFLAWSYLFSGTITELRCDAYSKAEADGRYLSSTGYTTALDGRYLVTNANAGSSEVFTVIRDPSAAPRQLRGILPRAPLGWSHILSGTVTELTCDAWSKTEADGRYATAGAISAVDARVTALENSGGVPADISCTSLTASSAVNTLNFTATGNTTGVDALFSQDVQTIGDDLLTINGGVNGVTVLGAGLVVAG
ncbi:unnamed protein product, partial [Symbiodinium pilosum]